ncbi:hypothetical protein NKG05_05810 [Oerskovia sp. M15]
MSAERQARTPDRWVLVLPETWWRIPLRDPVVRESSVAALVERRLGSADERATDRRQLRSDLNAVADQSAALGGSLLVMITMEVADILVTGTLVVYEIARDGHDLRAARRAAEARATNPEDVLVVDGALAHVVRSVTASEIHRTGPDGEPLLPELRLDYWVDLHGLENLLYVVITSPLVPCVTAWSTCSTRSSLRCGASNLRRRRSDEYRRRAVRRAGGPGGAAQSVQVPSPYAGTVPAVLFVLGLVSLAGYLAVVLWGRRWFDSMRTPRGICGVPPGVGPGGGVRWGVFAMSALEERAARSAWSAFENQVEVAYVSGALTAVESPSYAPPASVWPVLFVAALFATAVVAVVVVTVLISGVRWYTSTADPMGAVRTFVLVTAGGFGVVLLLGAV